MSGKRLSGRGVLAILLISFAVVFVVNVTFVVYSITTFPGEEEAESYAQGLKYNATLADRAAQAHLGWRATVAIAGAERAAQLRVQVRDASGAPVKGLQVSGALRRPVDADLDRALVFIDRGDGLYVAEVDKLAQGQWDLAAHAARPGSHFDIEKRLTWLPLARS